MSLRILLLAGLLVLACSTHLKKRQSTPQPDWLASGAHDTTCLTEGFSFINATHVFESCGLYGTSFFHVLHFTLNHQEETSLVETYRSPLFP
jgi:glutaminyl-peptide cyclotransferase